MISDPLKQRIEKARQYFEVAENWPSGSIRISNAEVVEFPAKFIESHLSTILVALEKQGAQDVWVSPYVDRLALLIKAQKTA